jgi:hypothetical protein
MAISSQHLKKRFESRVLPSRPSMTIRVNRISWVLELLTLQIATLTAEPFIKKSRHLTYLNPTPEIIESILTVEKRSHRRVHITEEGSALLTLL